ncbi:hypothetical protein [Lentzea sp. NBRC 102530]|uniref:hypothetical protein n=1 Tax=Lentzea sp. NBRC 102530 TaxID=3032201 RepID=UPI0024A5D0E5|nr:hypothetical protein [Lentzea sp. NBRC 102530]GLY46816.1 hypothetical protein Lesp01_04720 [Lentzea sp. NBRC 102530]
MATNFDPDAIRESAKKLGSIMDDMAAFEALKANWPNAGGFELAQRVERVVDDRRNGVVANAEHLKIALDDMRSTLTKIANDFEKADDDNAAKIKASIGDMASEIRSDTARFDQNTEQDQHNFTPGPRTGSSGTETGTEPVESDEDADENNSDGDGYDDVLPSDDADADAVPEASESSAEAEDENNSDGDGYDDVLPGGDGTQSYDSTTEDLDSLKDSADAEIESASSDSDSESEEEPKGNSDGYIAQ